MSTQHHPVAVVTGASSGIGEATARALAGAGYRVVCAARRTDRITALTEEIGGTAVTCDVTDAGSVTALAEVVGPRLDVLVNNAGGAFGADRVEGADLDQWRQMYEVNVLGVVRVTQALLPALRASRSPLIVNVGSTAGQVAYVAGGGYTAAKHGLHAVSQTMRLELNGEPVRVTEIVPGMVHTPEFSLVRFGDQARADAVYADVDGPLVAADVAEAVRWVASLPRHVNVDELVLRPVAQAAQHQLHRGPIFR
ncbi:MAG: SDR family oxidoreductase [Propionibacteriales bacterium]|nr:SDR family oxidoreductase [Propionibacteriales bacterium]